MSFVDAPRSRYQISGPAFSRVVLHLKSGDFEIVAMKNSADNVYIHSAKLNSRVLTSLQIEHAQVLRGGKLELQNE